jgi:hypothetical protein
MEKVLSLEEDFLLTLMEFEINPAKKEKIIELINQGIDWPKIISFAKASGLAPLFYKNFQNLNIIEFIPEDLINKFRNKYVKTLFENSKKVKYFELIIEELNKNNIDFIPLKGIYLIPTFYQDFGLRTMSDIDVLVRVNDVERCKEIFLKQDWKIKDMFHTDSIKKLNLSYTPYVFFKDGVKIDFHQNLYHSAARFKVPVEELWSRSKNQKFLNGNSKQLIYEDLILHQILHLYKHLVVGQFCFKSFIDIVTLIKKSHHVFNESFFMELVHKYNCNYEVSLINNLLKTYFSIEIFTQKEMQKLNKQLDIDLIFKSLLNGESQHVKEYFNKNKIVYIPIIKRLKHISGTKNTIIYVLGNLFPSKKYMVERYQIKKKYTFIYFYIYRIFTIFR